MTRPVPRRHARNPADSDLYERQEVALSLWAEKLKERQRLFAEREHVFEGTRLALGGPRRRRVPPPAASPAPEHLPRRVDVSRRASAAPSLATPLHAHTSPASFTGPSTSPRHSGSVFHLGSTEAPVPEARTCTPPASSSRRNRCTRRHKTDYFQPLPMVSSSDCFSHSPSDYPLKTHHNPISDSWDVSLLEDSVDWEDLFCSALPKTVNSGGRKTRTIPNKPANITHPVIISTPVSQSTPTPVPAPRRRAAATQSTATPASVSRVGVTGVQPPPVPVPAPRLRTARIQPDPPRDSAEALQPVPSRSGGTKELTGPPTTSPLHPPPDPAFHALAVSLVRLAEVSPAQAPALLAQAALLSPSLAHSLAQPLATPTSAPSSASPAVQLPLLSVPSPAVQLPLLSVPSPAVQLPLLSVPSPAVQLPLPSVPSPAVQLPLPSVPSPALQLPLPSVPSPALQLPLPSVPSPALQLPLPSVPSPALQLPLPSVPSPALQLPLPSVPSPALQLPLPSVPSPALQLPLPSVSLACSPASTPVSSLACSPVSSCPVSRSSVASCPVSLVASCPVQKVPHVTRACCNDQSLLGSSAPLGSEDRFRWRPAEPVRQPSSSLRPRLALPRLALPRLALPRLALPRLVVRPPGHGRHA
ncbi:proline-rich protein 36-like [Simochromis diagramma]|uniref:proline-rich protein 36-like n=1 Tax=Simochromis diagramma TaxID=43689 RepID=UPI001A7EF944|nr:proline-rich protein 36-like [Simochromis diagramma]